MPSFEADLPEAENTPEGEEGGISSREQSLVATPVSVPVRIVLSSAQINRCQVLVLLFNIPIAQLTETDKLG
ncbi:hypothetical protein L596_015277 [Steinernema carpocapsae]|uniref:Uncharacterized protein n=1 Tax=Steinernema carpocapsae TaxID=34508 RepID=A0A4U5NEH7_STECR|nr:hypothetical protein L596_015277 [Steinernema carpocapsae]